MTEPHTQKIRWRRLPDGSYWGVAPIGLAYRIERHCLVSGRQHWLLTEFPNEDTTYGEAIDTGPLGAMKRTAALEATCHAINTARECQTGNVGETPP